MYCSRIYEGDIINREGSNTTCEGDIINRKGSNTTYEGDIIKREDFNKLYEDDNTNREGSNTTCEGGNTNCGCLNTICGELGSKSDVWEFFRGFGAKIGISSTARRRGLTFLCLPKEK